MIKPIVRDTFFLSQKSDPAAKQDLSAGQDLRDTQGAVGNQPAGVGVLADDAPASGEPSGSPDMPMPGQEDYSINGTYYLGLDLYKVPVLATIPQPYDTWADIEDTFAWGGFQPLLGKNAKH